MPIELTCRGCGNTWEYKGSKRPIKREGKPDKVVYATCTICRNKVPIRPEDVKD